MQSLFPTAQNRTPERIPLCDGELLLYRNFFASDKAHSLFGLLLNEIPWQQETVSVYGKTHPAPRLSSWHGQQGLAYSYSGVTHQALPWTPTLQEIKTELEETLPSTFNSVLANLYRNGLDKVGWHADNESSLGKNPQIASLSLGASRRFDLKHIHHKTERLQIALHTGDMLIMQGPLQHFWLHQIPQQKKITDSRINLTFRQLISKT